MMDLDPSLTIFIWTPCTLQMYNLCSVVLEISGGSPYLEPDHAAASVNIIECVVYFVGAETIIMVSHVSPAWTQGQITVAHITPSATGYITIQQ